jgi:hypothetical protein
MICERIVNSNVNRIDYAATGQGSLGRSARWEINGHTIMRSFREHEGNVQAASSRDESSYKRL